MTQLNNFSRDQMAFILNAVPATISWLRSDLTYLMVNQQLAALFNQPVESFIGKQIGFYQRKSGNNPFVNFVKAVFASKQTKLTTELVIFVAGKPHYFYFVAHKYQDDTEAMIVGIDITERKRSEQAQAKQLAELRVIHAVSSFSVSVIDETELISSATTAIGQALYSDSFAVLLLDQKTKTLVLEALYPQDLFIPNLVIPLNAGIIGTVASTGKSIIANDVSKFPQYISSGHPVQSELCVPLKIGGRVIGVLNAESHNLNAFTKADERFLVTLAGQISIGIERLRGEAKTTMLLETLEMRVHERTQALKQANEQLLELDVLKSKFVSDVSHELRTPITNLNLYLDLLERGRAEKKERYMDVLKQESARLSRIIEPILNLSRLEQAVNHNAPQTVLDVNKIITQVAKIHLPLAKQSNLYLYLETADNLPMVMGNEEHLTQVFTNLISNAIHYTHTGGIWVKTAYFAQHKKIVLSVQDSGVGILPADQPHLFERFYRGEISGQLNIPGSGLGLAIVREIVQNHGGSVEVESKVGEGSLFQIWLPILEDDE